MRLRVARQAIAQQSAERGHSICVPVAQGGSAEVALLGEPLTRHWSERQWRKTGQVIACNLLEEHTFTWPAIKDGVKKLCHAQFEVLFVVSKRRLRHDGLAMGAAASSPRAANRGSLPKHLPRVEDVIEAKASLCGCGGGLHQIGEVEEDQKMARATVFPTTVGMPRPSSGKQSPRTVF